MVKFRIGLIWILFLILTSKVFACEHIQVKKHKVTIAL